MEVKLNRELAFELKNLKKFVKLQRAAEKIGFNYSYDIMDYLHNEIAFRMNKIEQANDDEYLVSIWKDGTVHVYDRKAYCEHKYGKNPKL